MSETRELVRRYHERFHPDQHEATPLTIPPELLTFRRRLHDEEVLEVAEAWNAVEARMGNISKHLADDMAHLLHELADLVIVAYGTATFLGVDLEDVVTLVMQANMRKIPNPDPIGKALKPPGFITAELAVREYVRVRTPPMERTEAVTPWQIVTRMIDNATANQEHPDYLRALSDVAYYLDHHGHSDSTAQPTNGTRLREGADDDHRTL